MESEIEGKWLDVNTDDIRQKLIDVGAELVQKERLMIRQVFDFPDRRLDKNKAWIRVRNEGDKVTLSFKQLLDRSVNGTKEVTTSVGSYTETVRFLEAIGLESKTLQESKRESWKLGKTEIEIDTWPWIPSYVEIEAETEAELKRTAQILGFDYSQVLHGSYETAYQAHYDVTDDELNFLEEMRFVSVPDWLENKRLIP